MRSYQRPRSYSSTKRTSADAIAVGLLACASLRQGGGQRRWPVVRLRVCTNASLYVSKSSGPVHDFDGCDVSPTTPVLSVDLLSSSDQDEVKRVLSDKFDDFSDEWPAVDGGL